MKTKTVTIAAALVLATSLGAAAAVQGNFMYNPRASEITRYFPSHTHDQNGTHGAPGHSGGTDIYGCHNASVPYHCH